jgi:hypothetical protein
MIRKLIVAAAAAAIVVALLPDVSAAKRVHRAKAPKCHAGDICTEKLDKVGKVTGWASVKTCTEQHKMARTPFPCYAPSGACPPATCKSKKK